MKNKKIIKIFCLFILLIIGVVISYTLAEVLENDVEVETNSELIYYLNVKYDGVDVFGYTSSDARVSEVNSNLIYVEDKLPEGLTFTGFVTTANGTIGAVERNNTNVSCLGSVVDDTNESGNSGAWINNNQEFVYHGLHYDESTRTVSFNVENLKAGCVLTVGVRTTTPTAIDDPNTVPVETRRDFYNFATASENLLTVFSNVVHVYMGNTAETLYTVTYQYDNGTSSNAVTLPPTTSYPSGAVIDVANDLHLDGYTFDGWSSNDVTITNGKFTMPSSNIVITGSFSSGTSHTVTYSLTGTTPPEYLLPIQKSYYTDSIVNLDTLKSGDVINGYVFNGWSSNDVTITNGRFTMPNSNVSIVGSFSEITYRVSYHFQGDVLPPNSDSLLPSTQTHSPGDIIVLQSMTEPSGYKFLGWYQEDGFVMPSEDVDIYGEWKRFAGTFEPSISVTDVTGKSYYKPGDIIRYRIRVTNNENYDVKDIILKENLSDSYFVAGNGYTVSSTMATIDEIEANSSFDVYAEYEVQPTDSNTVVNSVSIKGGSSDNYYELAPGTFSSSVTSNLQSKIQVCAYINGVDVGNNFQVKIYNANYEYYAFLQKDQCMTINVSPGTYSIFEILPQEYNLQSVTGNISSNSSNLVVSQGTNYQVNFTNRFKSKKFLHAFGNLADVIQGGQE